MSDKIYNEDLEDIFKDNAKVGTLGLDKKWTRISFVFYLRENIAIKCNAPKKYVINMRHDKEKMKNHKGVQRWEAVIGKHINIDLVKSSQLYCRHNTKDAKVQGMYGCLQSHLGLLKYIVDEKLDDICVLEDDSTSDFIIPDEVRTADHITYLGGWRVNLKMKDIKKPMDETLKDGINHLKNSRVLTTRAYYIPKWKNAEDLLNYIKDKKVWKAYDLMMSEYVKHLYYPALSHQIVGYKSTIGNFSPKLKYEKY